MGIDLQKRWGTNVGKNYTFTLRRRSGIKAFHTNAISAARRAGYMIKGVGPVEGFCLRLSFYWRL